MSPPGARCVWTKIASSPSSRRSPPICLPVRPGLRCPVLPQFPQLDERNGREGEDKNQRPIKAEARRGGKKTARVRGNQRSEIWSKLEMTMARLTNKDW